MHYLLLNFTVTYVKVVDKCQLSPSFGVSDHELSETILTGVRAAVITLRFRC